MSFAIFSASKTLQGVHPFRNFFLLGLKDSITSLILSRFLCLNIVILRHIVPHVFSPFFLFFSGAADEGLPRKQRKVRMKENIDTTCGGVSDAGSHGARTTYSAPWSVITSAPRSVPWMLKLATLPRSFLSLSLFFFLCQSKLVIVGSLRALLAHTGFSRLSAGCLHSVAVVDFP